MSDDPLELLQVVQSNKAAHTCVAFLFYIGHFYVGLRDAIRSKHVTVMDWAWDWAATIFHHLLTFGLITFATINHVLTFLDHFVAFSGIFVAVVPLFANGAGLVATRIQLVTKGFWLIGAARKH